MMMCFLADAGCGERRRRLETGRDDVEGRIARKLWERSVWRV